MFIFTIHGRREWIARYEDITSVFEAGAFDGTLDFAFYR